MSPQYYYCTGTPLQGCTVSALFHTSFKMLAYLNSISHPVTDDVQLLRLNTTAKEGTV